MTKGNRYSKPTGVDSPLWRGGRSGAQKRFNAKPSTKVKKHEYALAHREQNRDRLRRLCRETKVMVLTHYGGGKLACVVCGETNVACLTIDHIAGGGREQRRSIGIAEGGGYQFYRWLIKQDYPRGYQTLCMNCQFKKALG